MSILKELLAINEAAPIEISKFIRDRKDAAGDNAAAFTTKYAQALFRKGNLTWHGDSFHTSSGKGPAWIKAEQAALQEVYKENVTLTFDIDFSPLSKSGQPDPASFSLDVQLGENDRHSSVSEVYLAYSPVDDELYIGFDAHVHFADEDYHEAFDKCFKQETGETFDEEDHAHAAIAQTSWKKSMETGLIGMIFKVQHNGDGYIASEDIAPMEGGFYRGTYPIFKRHAKGLIELRLD